MFRSIFDVGAEGRKVDALAWSDNLAVLTTDMESAKHNLSCWRFNLNTSCFCDLKSDSLEVIPATYKAITSTVAKDDGVEWQIRHKTKCLGTWLCGTGSDTYDQHALMSAWTRAFWANSKTLLNRKASVLARLKIWKGLSFAIADHFWAGLKPSATTADHLEARFNKLCHLIVGLQPVSDDTAASFCTRRNRNLTYLKLEARVDVRFRFAYKVVTWLEHLTRHKDLPAYSFLISQTDEWLREKRYAAGSFGKSRNADAGATNTRTHPGFLVRWGSGWLEAMTSRAGGWENARKSKATSKERAQLLVDLLLRKPRRGRLALDDGII